ncbi:hypothetical protein [Actinacidiphila acidipaludis]|uniref:Secreted protein n=1 Tax=Actinacidiphila acidipaludis TaxID=2873382 RepID=A0ABS7Q721_9ACTN|nr:hypothetical protein [Streptomyces acidipaludis]MBY8878950.1 hypothetical protein [Streptomyces acidipaludis]
MKQLIRRGAGAAGALGMAAAMLSGAAVAGAATPSAAPDAVVHPMTSSHTTLWLPDGKRTATVWKTWYRKSNGKYHGHYGFTSASKNVQVFVVLWTSDRTRYLATEGKSYAYTNESRVQLFACYRYTTNGRDCTATW